ncbi:hypothetical protein A2U01_0073282, partial [Trifolium medium]|nr:hypothetical protein [Trifolium medium]
MRHIQKKGRRLSESVDFDVNCDNDEDGENDVLETMVFGTKGRVDFDENYDEGYEIDIP